MNFKNIVKEKQYENTIDHGFRYNIFERQFHIWHKVLKFKRLEEKKTIQA